MTETWKPIPGFEDYEASTLGNFRRRITNGYRPLKGRIDKTGYQQLGLMKNDKQRWLLAHRIIASMFLPIPAYEGFLTVNHKNCVRADNRVENLELISVADNASHWRRYRLEELAKGQIFPE